MLPLIDNPSTGESVPLEIALSPHVLRQLQHYLDLHPATTLDSVACTALELFFTLQAVRSPHTPHPSHDPTSAIPHS